MTTTLPHAVREAVHDISGSLCALQGYSFLLRRRLAPGSDEADLLDCIDEAIARLRTSSERLAAAVPASAPAPQR
jgi:hypothetical protein